MKKDKDSIVQAELFWRNALIAVLAAIILTVGYVAISSFVKNTFPTVVIANPKAENHYSYVAVQKQKMIELKKYLKYKFPACAVSLSMDAQVNDKYEIESQYQCCVFSGDLSVRLFATENLEKDFYFCSDSYPTLEQLEKKILKSVKEYKEKEALIKKYDNK